MQHVIGFLEVIQVRSVYSAISNLPDFSSSASSLNQELKLLGQSGKELLSRVLHISELDTYPIMELADIELGRDDAFQELSGTIKDAMDKFNSDKGSRNGYAPLYAATLGSRLKRGKRIRILEVGIGTNDIEIPSNMGTRGSPGASLRAWASISSNVEVVGLDVDPKTLFIADRIRASTVDQLSPSSFDEIPQQLVRDLFDLVIDDGLHAPLPNINTVIACLPLLKKDGVLVVEDVVENQLGLWKLVQSIGVPRYIVQIIQIRNTYCVVFSRQPL